MNSQDVVLISRERVSDRLAQVVADACRALNMAAVSWDGGERLPELSSEPALIVSMLLAGDRRIPENATRLLSRFLPHVPLLLLTEERLVRPSVLLHEGKVVLLGAPLSDLRVMARIRSMLQENRRLASPAARMSQLGRAFIASVGREKSPDLPVVLQQVGRCCTGFLRRKGDAPIADVDARLVASALEERGESGIADIPSEIRTSTTLVHLSLRSDQWLFHVPRPGVMVVLASPYRAPGSYDVAEAISRRGQPSLTVPARPADVIWAAAEPSAETDLRHLMLDGGPALVHGLEARFDIRPASPSSLVVELQE